MADFATQLKRLRKKKGLTQEALAEQLGLRKTTICNYEIGYSNPQLSTLTLLAQFFGVSIDDMLGLPPEPDEGIRIDIPVFQPTSGNSVSDMIAIPKTLLKNGKYFIIQLADDLLSTSNLYKDDLILCKYESDVPDGTLAAVTVNGKVKAIRYLYRSNNKITLVSSEKLPPEIYDETQITILGRAVKALVSLEK